MKKLSKAALLNLQIREAVNSVRKQANVSGDFDPFYEGMQSGASSVLLELSKIQRRDAGLIAEGLYGSQ